jgi:hypothetical protein
LTLPDRLSFQSPESQDAAWVANGSAVSVVQAIDKYILFIDT